MASFIKDSYQVYLDLMEQADPRVKGFFMMSSIWPEIIITLLYFYVVLSAGPRFMKNREPYDIKNIMLLYNFAMVLLSGYTCLEFGLSGWFVGYSFRCQPVDYSSSPQSLRMVNVCWIFYFTKNIELLDTVFFVLRKKNSQVTFLHVFHHGIMPLSWWIGVNAVAGGFGTFHALLNSFVHFVMYFYYFMAALGPQYQKYLWWKKYMTSIQITQFILVTIHSVQLFFMDCNYPTLFAVWILSYALIFLVMFGNFYIKSYSAKKPKSVKNNSSNGAVTNGFKHD